MSESQTEEFETSSVAETERAGAKLAVTLSGGECVALDGNLGAGKTQFVRGLVAGLGGDGRQVSSPTYVLLHVYGDRGRSTPPPPRASKGATPRLHPRSGGAQAEDSSAAPTRPMRLVVYHLDAYRASGADELEAVGFSELLDQGGVVVVEWAARISDLLPADRIEVGIEATGTTQRRITVRRPLRCPSDLKE